MLIAECSFQIQLRQPAKKACLISQLRSSVVVWVSSFPVGENHHARTRLPDHARNLQTVFPIVLHAAVGNIQRMPPGNALDSRCFLCLSRPIFGGSARPHLALRQVEDASALSALGHLEQRPAAGLLNVITVRGNSQNIQSERCVQSRFPCSKTTFSRTIRRCAAISFNLGNTRLTCSSVSTKIMMIGSLPPASTKRLVFTRWRPRNPPTACRVHAAKTFSSCK